MKFKFKVGDTVRISGMAARVVRVGHRLSGEQWVNYQVTFSDGSTDYFKASELQLTKERKTMGNSLRQRVRNILRSKDDQLLIDQGFTHENGGLTLEGRKVVADLAFTNGLKEEVVKIAQSLDDASKKKKE